MRGAVVWAGAGGLAVMTAAAAALVLPACGLRLPFGLGTVLECPEQARLATPSGGDAARAALLAEIGGLERDIALLACTPERAEAPLLPPPPPEPPPELDEDMIEEADLGALRGCWMLDSPYRAQNRATGAITDYSEWTICFDGSGSGRETMRGSDGSTCEGAVTGSFLPGEALVIDEAEDLPCSNSVAILRRQVTCRLDADQRAVCNSYQPESGSNAEVIMRRAPEAP